MDHLRRVLEKKLYQQPDEAVSRGDQDLNPDWEAPGTEHALIAAAVLVPLIERPDGIHVLLTKRTEDMPTHPGQVSFPGGRVQNEDRTHAEAALRETHEEVGIVPGHVTIAGFLDHYETGSNYRILPVVGIVNPYARVKIDPREVDLVFEVPLSFLMDPAHHEKRSVEWNGVLRYYYAIPYKNHKIWGATAGMIRSLYERLYGS